MHNCITSEWYSQSERSETANDDFYLYMKLIETYWKCPTLRMLPPASERCNRGHNRGFTGVIRGFQTNRHFPPQKYSHTAIYVIIKLLYIDFKCQLKGLKNPPQVNLSFTVKNLSSRRLKTNNYANDERSMLMLLRHSSLADLNKTIRNHPLKVKLHGMALLADELPTEIVAVVSSEHGKNIDIMWYQYVNMISFYMNLRWACNFLKSRAYLPSRQINTKSPLHSLWPLAGWGWWECCSCQDESLTWPYSLYRWRITNRYESQPIISKTLGTNRMLPGIVTQHRNTFPTADANRCSL